MNQDRKIVLDVIAILEELIDFQVKKGANVVPISSLKPDAACYRIRSRHALQQRIFFYLCKNATFCWKPCSHLLLVWMGAYLLLLQCSRSVAYTLSREHSPLASFIAVIHLTMKLWIFPLKILFSDVKPVWRPTLWQTAVTSWKNTFLHGECSLLWAYDRFHSTCCDPTRR